MFKPTLIIIGHTFLMGDGTPIDMDKALAYYLLAAEQKYTTALNNAIMIYVDRWNEERIEAHTYTIAENSSH